MSPEIGLFARVFPAQPPADLAATIDGLGFGCVQLNLAALGLPTIPGAAALAALDPREIREAFASRGVRIWGLSATYNMAHPDAERRRADTRRAAEFVLAGGGFGAVAASLCTGSRDPDNQWRAHPDNASGAAWEAMLESFTALVPAAREAGLLLAVEPEPGNVVRDADAALRLLADLGADAERVCFILDPANLVAGRPASEWSAVLSDAFARLGDKTACVHAKDVVTWTERLVGGAEGLDFDLVARLHARLPRPVPIIIQDTLPGEASAARALVLAASERAGS